MTERHWKGIAKADKADDYIKHLVDKTFPELKKINGFISAIILKRPVAAGMEFLVITTWDSLEAVSQFAGRNIDKAVVPDIVQELMIDFDEYVLHYDVVLNFNPGDEEKVVL